MSRLKKLREADTRTSFAELLGYTASSLSFILYRIDESKKYTTFTIPKKDGGHREIKAPDPRLKELQRRLAELLNECVEELLSNDERHVENSDSPPTRRRAIRAVAHGFKKGLSIKTNAEHHLGRKFVFNLDLKDFFPSINFGRVYGFFIKNKDFLLNPSVAAIIAKIACHENQLPQGSPCSPVISNLVGKILDRRLLQLAKKHKCTYTRYADDLTFSTSLPEFPGEIARYREGLDAWAVGPELRNEIVASGFKINPRKTRMQFRNSRQIVTGLVVNKTVNTKSEYYRYARSMCHALFTSGNFYLPTPSPPNAVASANQGDQPHAKPTLQQLEGILNYIYDVKSFKNKFARKGYRASRHDGFNEPKHDTDTPKYPPMNRSSSYADESHQICLDGIKNLYWRFLFYKNFYALEAPLIVNEGKTDNIYLHCAIKSLASHYPQLIKQQDGNIVPNVRFFNRTPITSEMMKLAEGVGGQKFIMLGYHRMMKRYRGIGKRHPVIMIADNDAEGRTLLSAASKYGTDVAQRKTDQQGTGFLRVTDNLYLIMLPKKDNRDTAVEDYFSPEVLATVLNGKSFNRTNTPSDNGSHYGKQAFARDVVRARRERINFDGFHPLLRLIVEVINDYQRIRTSGQT